MHDKELQEILDKIKEYAPNTDTTLIEKAYYLAKSAHEGILRKSGEPYIIHPIAVANILVDMQLDIETISAGLLHDVIEDTDYTYDDIKEMFSKEVADLVDGVTKLGQIKYQSKEETQAENLRKMFLAMAKDIRVILIKLADRLHNMRTLKYMPEEKAKYKAKETLEIYGGIAHRLGISKVKWELEDLALRYIDPDGYYDLVDKVSMKRSQREEYISRIVHLLQEKFNEVNIDCEVYGRPKHFYSIYKKMKNKHKTFEEIFDLTAVRIVVDTIKDCYAVLGMVHTLWVPMPGRFKDYIAMPKANMYQSLHTTVIGPEGEPVEIQIRTHEMHNIAEYGIAAHWKYKEGTMSNNEKMEEKLKWLRQMMEWEKEVKDPQEFLDSLKEDVFNSQVYVFTPKGDVIELPAESTPIDFAYRVHSKVGNKCVGAKINGRLVPIDYKLQNGEIVEVITSSNSTGPSRDWLKIVKTPNARNRIRQFFKKERREENIQKGYEVLEKEFKRYEIPLKDSSIEKFMEQIAKKFNQPSLEDLIATIGYGGITASQVVPKVRDFYLKEEKKKEKENKQKEEHEDLSQYKITDKEYKEKRKKSSSGVIVKGLDNILVRFAKCCNPLPGDEIVGYVTKGRGVAIHRADCPNCKLDNELFQKRLVDVEWDNPKKSKFEGEIRIVATDRKSMLSDVTHMIAVQKLNINGINARKSKDGITHINLLIEVNDISELINLMKKLKAIPGVDEVFRVRN